MKAYKGFNRRSNGTLWCMDFQYESGKTYKHKGNIELCESGFHACHELHQLWLFYPNNGENVFWEVECCGDVIESKDDSGKFVCSEIKLIQPIDMNNVALFDCASYFSEGFARIGLNGKCNFINTEGQLLSEQWFDDVWNFSEGFATVKIGRKYNFVDIKGNLLSNQWFDDVGRFYKGLARVEINGRWRNMDKQGIII